MHDMNVLLEYIRILCKLFVVDYTLFKLAYTILCCAKIFCRCHYRYHSWL